MLAERTRRSQFLLGGRQARHIAPAILLGLTAGTTCGWNLSFAMLVTLALWLNTPLVLLASSCVAGLAIALFCEDLATTIGRGLLDKCDLGSAFYTFAPGPTAALFGLDDYRLVGNLALGLVIGLPAAHALSRLMCRAPAGDDEPEPTTADPLLRPLGFVVAAACVGGTATLLNTIGPQLVGEAALERLTAAVGAPVSVDRFDYDLWRGELEITNLRVGDAQDGRTVFTARRVEGRVEPGLFLRGRLHADEFAVGGVSFDLSATTRSEKALAIYARRPSILKEDGGEAPAAPVEPAADVEVQTMLRHASKTNNRLAALGAAIGQVEWIADLEAPHTAGGKRLDVFVRRKSAPRDGASGRAAPLVKLKQVRIDGPVEYADLGPKTQITLANLTSRPSTAARHAQMTLVDETNSFRLQTTFHLSDPERQHAVSFELADMAGTDLVSAAAIGAFDVRGSRVEMIRGNGTATRERFDIRMLLLARGIKASSTAGRVAGVDGQLLGEALEHLSTVQLAMRADGRWAQPRLNVSPAGALRDLKTLLRAGGAGEWATAIETGKRPAASTIANVATTASPGVSAIVAATTLPASMTSVGPTTNGAAAATTKPAATGPMAGNSTPATMMPSGAAPTVAASTAPDATRLVATEPAVVHPATLSPQASQPLQTATGAATSAPAKLSAAGSTPAAVAALPAATPPTAATVASSTMEPAALTNGKTAAGIVANGTPASGTTPSNTASTAVANTAAAIPGARNQPQTGAAGIATAAAKGEVSPAGSTAPLSQGPTVQRTTHMVAQRPAGAVPAGAVPVGAAVPAGTLTPAGRAPAAPVASTLPAYAVKNESTVLASDEFSTDQQAVVGPRLSTDGLRQPNSVLTPSAGGGPTSNLTGNPAGNSAATTTSRTATYNQRPQSVPQQGESTPFDRTGGDAAYATQRRSPAGRSSAGERTGTSQPASGGAYRNSVGERGFSGGERMLGEPVLGEEEPTPRDLPTLPRRSLIARDGTTPRPSGDVYERLPLAADEGTAYDVPSERKPAKKSLFSGVSKLFGKPETATTEDRPVAEPPAGTYYRDSAPERRPSTASAARAAESQHELHSEPAPEKSESFPMIRSLFGSKPKPRATESDRPIEQPRETPPERGLFGGSKNYNDKPKTSAPKGKGIFGSLGSGGTTRVATDEREYATPSGYVSDSGPDGSTRNPVPTAEYEAPVGYASGAVPAGGGTPRVTDLEPARNPEQISAGKPWYERMVR
jgi:hypothetical protein